MKTRSNIPPPPKSARTRAHEPLTDSAARMAAQEPLVDSVPPGTLVIHDKYKIVQKVGSGGMGDVYMAEVTKDDEAIGLSKGQKVAVKIINQINGGKEDVEGRFILEAEAAMKIEHENVIEIYQIGKAAGRIFLVMEYLEGTDVKGLICQKEQAGERFTWAEARQIIGEVCAALHAAHEKNIIHRDLKPENIFLAENGRRKVKVLDFGYAKFIDGQRNLTVGDLKVGTPSYVAPEQIFSETYDHRADLYSFGIVIYEMIAGRPPFVCDKKDPQWILKMLTKHREELPRRPSELVKGLDIPKSAEDALMKALSKDPAERFGNALEMRDALLGKVRESKKSMPAVPAVKERESRRTPAAEPRAAEHSEERRVSELVFDSVEESVPEGPAPSPKASRKEGSPRKEQGGGWSGLRGAVVGAGISALLILGYYNREKIERFVNSLDREHQVAPSRTEGSNQPRQAPTTFELRVQTEPPGASVYDVTGGERSRNYLGSTPLDVFVPNGERTLIIVKRGYAQRRLTVSPSSADHTINLARPRPRTEAPQTAPDAGPEERVEVIEE